MMIIRAWGELSRDELELEGNSLVLWRSVKGEAGRYSLSRDKNEGV